MNKRNNSIDLFVILAETTMMTTTLISTTTISKRISIYYYSKTMLNFSNDNPDQLYISDKSNERFCSTFDNFSNGKLFIYWIIRFDGFAFLEFGFQSNGKDGGRLDLKTAHSKTPFHSRANGVNPLKNFREKNRTSLRYSKPRSIVVNLVITKVRLLIMFSKSCRARFFVPA